MDNSRLNQTELSYSSNAGDASVNPYTGRMLFSRHDISIGVNSYKTDVSHIYNSQFSKHLPSTIDPYMGEGWKLNVQQYLYPYDVTYAYREFANGDYVYIDGSGMRHKFKCLEGNEYYDTSGLGLILNTTTMEMTDQIGNKLTFEGNKLVKTTSHHSGSPLIKRFEYAGDKLKYIYDNRKDTNKLEFRYDESNGLLKLIMCKRGAETLKTIIYHYNENNELIKTTTEMSGFEKISALFQYENSKLVYAVNYEDKSALWFGYTSDKVTLVTSGVVTVKKETFVKEGILYCSDNTYCKSDTICSKGKNIEERYVISNGQSFDHDVLIKNSFQYEVNSQKCTAVTNILDKEATGKVVMMYYFNEEGFTTAILEAHNGNYNDLRALEKMSGVSAKSSDGGMEKINTQNNYTTAGANEINFHNISELTTYRNKKCNNYIYYKCNFWLKLRDSDCASDVQVTVLSKNTENAITKTTDIGKAYVDKTAVGVWQFVSVPVKISKPYIHSFSVNFPKNPTKSVALVCDMRLCYSPISKCLVTNDTNYTPLEDIRSISYSKTVNSGFNTRLVTDDFYMSEKDLQMTYLSMYNASPSSGNRFILSLCDGTERELVDSVKLFGDEVYPIQFGKDEYGGTRAQFSHETISPDGDLYTYNIPHFVSYINEINTPAYCMLMITEASKSGEKSFTKTYIDLKGRLRCEVDEYGVITRYDYDEYDSVRTKTISHKETGEKLVFSARDTDSSTIETAPQSYTNTKFDEVLGNVDSSSYGGYENDSDMQTSYFGYNVFKDRLTNVQNDVGAENGLYYDGSGRLALVTPTNYAFASVYGYKVKRRPLGNQAKYYKCHNAKGVDELDIDELLADIGDYDGNVNESTNDFLMDVRSSNASISTYKFRDSPNNPDRTHIYMDKYGRTKDIIEQNSTDWGHQYYKQTTIERQKLWESAGACEITEMYDPFENRTYIYSYDDFNNPTGYESRNGLASGEIFFSIDKTGENKVEYRTGNEIYGSQTIYENNKLIEPRIDKTDDILYVDVNGSRSLGRTSYSYDKLGRIKEKQNVVYDGPQPTGISTEYIYENGTLNKRGIKTKISNAILKDTMYDFTYVYDKRGNMTSGRLSQTEGSNTVKRSADYTYDKANRLKTETMQGKTTEYYYGVDGSIICEASGGKEKDYTYEKGRLVDIDGTKFSYDNFGNCTHYKSTAYNMSWTRGSLLRNYAAAGADGKTLAEYSYNNKGVRCKKVVGEKTTTYYHDGGKLIGEDRSDGDNLRFMYDTEGIIGFKLPKKDYIVVVINPYPFHYVKDAMGNVVSILDNDEEVAHYEYDAWGNCTITKDTKGIGTLNPIRWKSQYYDQESGLYYMNGRYYSPLMKRYISAASPESVMANAATIYGLNPYLITLTNPVNMGYNGYNIEISIPLAYDPDELSKWDLFWGNYGGWITSGIQFGLGAVLCFVPGAQGLGVALLASGVVGFASNTMTSMGMNSKTASMISSGLNVAAGIGLLFTPFAPVGASMIGAGIGSFAGGHISEWLGGSYQLGSVIGGIAGGIIGGKVYDHIVFSRIAEQGILIGGMGEFEAEAAARGLAHYDGMPGYSGVKTVLGGKMTRQLAWANNHRYISNVMKHGGSIYSLGSGGVSYAKEIALIGNYPFLFWI